MGFYKAAFYRMDKGSGMFNNFKDVRREQHEPKWST